MHNTIRTFTLVVLMTILSFALFVQGAPTYGPVPPDPNPDSPPRSPKKDERNPPRLSRNTNNGANRKHLVGH